MAGARKICDQSGSGSGDFEGAERNGLFRIEYIQGTVKDTLRRAEEDPNHRSARIVANTGQEPQRDRSKSFLPRSRFGRYSRSPSSFPTSTIKSRIHSHG